MKFRPEYVIGGIIFLLSGAGLAFLLLQPGAVKDMLPAGEGRPYAEIVNPSGFVNTDPITIKQFVGKKVILVDFLTYSCINCQRTFPYMNAWYKAYKDQGLEIVGIHTPEFAFEKDINNVREAMKKFGIEYPIVLDNDYSTWSAWGNRYWPRKYLIDIHGNVVYDHIGEGAYDETERMIRKLLDERAQVLGETHDMGGTLASDSVPVVSIEARSPETYFGAARNEFLGNGQAFKSGLQSFTAPSTPQSNKLYLTGTWLVGDEYAESASDATSVIYHYTAREVYIVSDADTPKTFEVWQDGKKVSDEAGADVSGGQVTVHESRLYKLIKNQRAGTHTLELRVKGKGVRFFAFTFG